MKLTAGEVYQAYQSVQELAKEKLPVKAAYWLNRMLRKLEPEFKTIDDQRNELIKKHGTTQDDGSTQVMNGSLPAFMSDFQSVLATEIEVDCPTVKLELLGDGEIAGGALVPLDKFIEA